MHYYQHHIGDFIKDTSFLTNEEIGIYMKLIWLYYDTEKPLPNDIFTLSMKAGARENQEALTGILEMFFTVQDDEWHHSRCDKEIAEFHGFIEAKSRAGKASAERRLNMRSTPVEQVSNKCSSNEQLTTTHNPLPTTHLKTISSKRFEEFWDAYGKKRGKAKALKEWQKAKITDELAEKLIEQSKKQVVAIPDPQFRKDPERWIKGNHWEDEIVVLKAPEEKLMPLGTDAQIESAYRIECGGDPSRARFNSYQEMRKFVQEFRDKRKIA